MSVTPIEKPQRVRIAPEVIDYEWRTGKTRTKEARNIYAQKGEVPSKEDTLLGSMLTPALAKEVVDAHNGWLD